MTRPTVSLPDPDRRLRRALALTRIGLAAERLVRAFWPLVTIVLAALSALMFGLQDVLALEVVWALSVGALLGGAAALVLGVRRFRWPGRADAGARLDATLPGRPLAALADRQAVGAGDPASEAVWRAHLDRMTERARAARAVRPRLSIARHDPYALRYVALVAFAMALLFGSVWRVASVAGMAPGGGAATATASWEGWIEPPAYTGKPSLYLADLPAGPLAVPVGSRLTIRLYGTVGALIVDETISGRTGEPAGASEPAQSLVVAQDGTLAIRGPGGRAWEVRAIPDVPPDVAPDDEPARTVAGEMTLGFHAGDDYGVISGEAAIALDLGRVDRRYGLVADPEPRPPVTVDLPLPLTGERTAFGETLTEDLSQHPWAMLPVRITLSVRDALGQEGAAPALETVLPGRRFFDTMAQALVENRRDLLWNRDNAGRVTQVLRAVSWQPDDVFRQPGVYLKLRTLIRRIETDLANGPLSDSARDEAAGILWTLALEIEDGSLEDALERLRQAQERLADAIRGGATPDEIARLTDDLRQAMDDYIARLAENAPDGTDQPDQGGGQAITGADLDRMLAELQKLMEEGRTAEAQALLEQLGQMMQNMQVTRGPGQGNGPAGEARKGLSQTLRDQQELSDDTFSGMQDRMRRPGEGGGQGDGGAGQDDGAGPGPGAGPSGDDLARRQRALREMLDGQRGALPGAGTPEGDAAREALDRAGRAMEGAGRALERSDLGGALDGQAEAMEALRDGVRSLGALEARERGEGSAGDVAGNPGQGSRGAGGRDPLGREAGRDGGIGTDRALLQGQDVYRRARELLDELRRRSGDRARPQGELDYLLRLLDRF